MLRRALSFASAVSACLALVGCANTPSPLVPSVTGSVGVPHRGVLTAGVELPKESPGLAWLRNDDRHYGYGLSLRTEAGTPAPRPARSSR